MRENNVSNSEEELVSHHRSWSAPACTLSHLSERLVNSFGGGNEEPDLVGATSSGQGTDIVSLIEAAAAIGNPRIPVSMGILSLFPCWHEKKQVASQGADSVRNKQISSNSPENSDSIDHISSLASSDQENKPVDKGIIIEMSTTSVENLVGNGNIEGLKRLCETLQKSMRQMKDDSERQIQDLHDRHEAAIRRCEALERENKEMRAQQAASRSQIQLLIDNNKVAMEHCEELEKEKEDLAFELKAEREKNEKLQEEVTSLQQQCYEQFNIMDQCNHLMELHASTSEK